ncbi:MAG: hypothetical protein AMJ58_09005 [Gammaproteobacteria bacterium SG8_30]|jgi:hypothetical protein|nr:MAG: hypothetical protein AMJ58_09005 [Gammaproteobacteria bacterium SG8_30]
MELLRDIAKDGFPTDYLIARVRARRAAVTREWRAALARKAPPSTSDEAIWDGLLEEYAWLYGQMDARMRARLAPVLALFELKTLVLCLRNIDAGRREEVARLLEHSLLAEPVVSALRTAGDVRTALAALAEVAPSALGAGAGALEDAYAKGGLKNVENRLVRAWLAQAVKGRLAPSVRAFLVAFIDLRNVVTVYKRLRWEIEDEEPAFIAGGSLLIERLAAASARGAMAQFDALVREVAGRDAPPLAASETALETVLLGHLAGRLREDAREGGDVAVLLDYLWRLYVAARNRALLLHADVQGTAMLERELIA